MRLPLKRRPRRLIPRKQQLDAQIRLTATHVMPAKPLLARQLLGKSLLTWFVFDSTGSWISGAGMNVSLNLALLLLFLVPLYRMEAAAKAESS